MSCWFTSAVMAGQLVPSAMPLRSGGVVGEGGSWVLDRPDYLGVYIQLEQDGTIEVSVSAVGSEGAEVTFELAVGRHVVPIRLTGTDEVEVSEQLPLQAGTYLFRLERRDPNNTRRVTIKSVQIDGCVVHAKASDELALQAADTYIRTERQGVAVVNVPELAHKTLTLRQIRSPFDFGANVYGQDARLVDPKAAEGSEAAKFQAFFLEHFNALVPSNLGKWGYNEPEMGKATPGDIDAVLAFGEKNQLRIRMHALIWDTTQQPAWVLALIEKAEAGDVEAVNKLRQAISGRIEYYVAQRANLIDELDVLNESFHQPRYLRIFGLQGIAGIYAETAAAISRSGAQTRTYINEYNVLQHSSEPPYGPNAPASAGDPYANWYRNHAFDLMKAGARLGGIGVQYYARSEADESVTHSAARMHGVLSNLALTGLPITLTEFGIQKGADEQTTLKIMEDSLRVAFGSAGVTGFYFFGFKEGAMWNQAPGAVLADKDWTLTALGRKYAQLRQEWTTRTQATADAQGGVRFVGFFGTYEMTDGHKTWTFEHAPGAGPILLKIH